MAASEQVFAWIETHFAYELTDWQKEIVRQAFSVDGSHQAA